MEQYLKIALAEVGYLEKATNASLYDKTANAGRCNFTKYAADLDKTDLFNGPKNGYEWCAVFVCWCMVEAVGLEAARRRLYLPKNSLAASCTRAVEYYRRAGAFGSEPRVGAQIFFQSGGGPCHTGLVYALDGSFVYTVEGNTSGGSSLVANGGGVAKKRYPRGDACIYGYGYPGPAGDTEPAEAAPPAILEFSPAKTYRNGSTPETVYADTGFLLPVGSLNPWESCDCLGRVQGGYLVRYRVDGTDRYKVGFAAYHGGLTA